MFKNDLRKKDDLIASKKRIHWNGDGWNGIFFNVNIQCASNELVSFLRNTFIIGDF